MELFLLNDNLERIAIVPEYESLIWRTGLMTSTADLKASTDCFADIDRASWLERSDSDTILFVSKKSVTDVVGDRGAYLSAYDPVELLRRRVLFWTHNFGTATTGMRREEIITRLVAQAFSAQALANPDNRAIPFMNTMTNTNASSRYLNERLTQQMSWGNIYERIESMLEGLPLRFFSRFNSQAKRVTPMLYEGVDRSQEVIVSTEHGDLFDIVYNFESVDRNTLGVVAGQGEGSDREVTVARDRTLSPHYGELWVDANDIGSEGEGGAVIPQAQVIAALQARGIDKLHEQPCEHALTGTVSQKRYQYGIDYLVGDRIGYEAFGAVHNDVISAVEEVFEGKLSRINITIGATYPTVRQILNRSMT